MTEHAKVSVVAATLPEPEPISVNGTMIPRETIARETQNHPAERPFDAWLAAARALVVRELLLQEAARLGIDAEPLSDGQGRTETTTEATIRALLEREVKTPAADDDVCQRYYKQNRERFRVKAPQPGDILPYEAVRARIAAYLTESVERRALAQYVTILAGRAQIAGIALTPADSPLVQ